MFNFTTDFLQVLAKGDIVHWIINIFAIVTGGYTVYKYFEKPKITVYLGDAVFLVVSPNNRLTINVACNLVNTSSKVGTVHRLDARIVDPKGKTHVCGWRLFYNYQPGGFQVSKDSDTYAVSVGEKDSKPLNIQFEEFSEREIDPFFWTIGTYEFQIIGWMNRKNRREKTNIAIGIVV